MKQAKQLTLDEIKISLDESEEVIGSVRRESKRNKGIFREFRGYYDLPEGWRWVKLGDVSIINPSKKEISNLPDEIDVSFIPMAYVDENSGTIINQDVKKLKEVRQGYTYFKEGDILFAKITPCMENGKCAVAKGLINGIGFGSTEFHVIRPKDEYILPEYIHLYLRQEWVRNEATKYFTGAVGQQRVPDSFLKRLPIPFPFKNNKPDIEEQKRIVARIEELFSKIDRIKELRRQAKEQAENLLKSALHHVFSKADEKGWKWVRLGDIAKTTSGGTPNRSIKEYWENGTIPWVKSGELEDNVIMDTEEKITPLGLKNSNCKLLPKGTLLVAMYGATVGKTAILGIEATTNQAVCAIFPKENIDRNFIRYYIIYVRPKLIERSRNLGGAQPNISQEVIKSLKIPIPFKNGSPDLEEQKRVAEYLDKIAEIQRKLLNLYEQTEKELETLKQAILSKAFRGEL